MRDDNGELAEEAEFIAVQGRFTKAFYKLALYTLNADN